MFISDIYWLQIRPSPFSFLQVFRVIFQTETRHYASVILYYTHLRSQDIRQEPMQKKLILFMTAPVYLQLL